MVSLLNIFVILYPIPQIFTYLLLIRLLFKPGPRSKTSFYGDRAFAVAAPILWNDIPVHIRCAPSLTDYKSKLKTYLFN